MLQKFKGKISKIQDICVNSSKGILTERSIEKLFNRFTQSDVTLFIIRFVFGFRLIYGSIDNIISWERMLEFKSFLENHHFPLPLACAFLSVYLQFFAGFSWIIGYKIKLFSLIMIGNFLIATYIHLVAGDPYLAITPAMHLLVISILLFAINPGKISISKYYHIKE